MDGVSAEKWHLEIHADGTTTLVAQQTLGHYTLETGKVAKFAAMLDAEAITTVLDGTIEKSRCLCPLHENQSRCQHKFNFNQVSQLRAEYYSSRQPVLDAANKLKAFPENRSDGVSPDGGGSPRETRVVYYLLNVRVCRPFYMQCLGISKHVCDEISGEVRGRPTPTKALRQKLPEYKQNHTQYDVCVAFWRSFFGEQAQTSGDGHRYFPVNLSCLHIYLNMYWPWWKDVTGQWPSAHRSQEPPLGSDPELAKALARPNFVLETSDDVEALFQSIEESYGREQHSEDEKQKEDEDSPEEDHHDRRSDGLSDGRSWELSEEMQEVMNAHPDDDLLLEDRARRVLKELQRETGFPSYSTFMRARYDPQFKDVKRREKHFHCRCAPI
jgi:hypothetical protein